jgi:hypothetical protein
LATTLRQDVDRLSPQPPTWWSEYVRSNRLTMNPKNPRFPAAVAFVLDHLDAAAGEPTAAAVNVGASLRSMLRFLHADHDAWRASQSIRSRYGLGNLSAPS